MNNQCAGVWVKASKKTPKNSHTIYFRIGHLKYIGFFDHTIMKFFSNLGSDRRWLHDKSYNEIEWLDETQSSTVTNDKLISELQERAEIAEDELDKIKQSDKISDEEIQVMADNYVSKELAHYMRRYQEAGRKDFIKGAKAIRDKLSVNEHSSEDKKQQ